jgi:hypothetical protein
MSRNQMDLMAAEQAPAMDRLRAEGEQLAGELDELRNRGFEQFSPQGKFSKKSLQALTKAVNAALEVFRQPPLPLPEEDIDGSLPVEHVKAIMMISDAMADSGVGEAIDLTQITDDKSLVAVAGKIDAAAKDKAFKSFLAKPLENQVGEVETETQVEVEEEVPEGMHSMPDGTLMKDEDMEDEELMMSRMR